MNNKPFIKLGNKSFNIQMINCFSLNDDDCTVVIDINFEIKKFRFKSEEQYNRFKSYLRLFSTEFDSEIEMINENDDEKKTLLTD
jgi:hypothetical protein